MNRPSGGADVRFARHRPLLSDRQWEIIREARIVVAGAGGLGSHVLDLIVRLGVRRLEIWDPGVLDEPDLNRQSLYVHADLGRPKVEAAVERLRAIVPDAHIEGVAEAVTPASPLGRHIGGVDICFDCVDSFAARGALEAAVVERWNRASGEIADSIPRANLGTRGSDDGEDIPHAIVHGGVTGYYGQVVVLRPPEVGYAAVFGNDFARTEAALKPVMPHSVAIVAATQVAELLRWLVNPEEPTRARLVVLDALSADNRVIEVVV